MRSLLTALWALVAGLVKSIGEVTYLALTRLMTRTGALAFFDLPDGAQLHFADPALLGVAKAFTSVTNDTEGVALFDTGHALVDDDIAYIVASSWPRLKNRVFRAKDVDTDGNVTLEGIDTSDTAKFSGTATGTAKEVPDSAWVAMPYIQDAATQGGEQQYVTLEFLDFDEQFEEPTSKTPRRFTCNLADDQTAPHFAKLVSANDNRTPLVIRITLPTDDTIYWVAIVSFDKIPRLTKGQLMANATSMAIRAEPTRYAAA